MTTATKHYHLWIDRDQSVASFHPVDGFEFVHFTNHDTYQAELWILIQSGFRFQ